MMAQPTWIGRTLNGRYKIDALLGQGGMSAVYKAYDPNLKRVVAVKLIHPHLSMDEDFIYRFKKEAAAVAAFRHPNIVQVYDFNTDEDVYYMVLEFIPGETLQDRLHHLKKRNTKMPFDQAVRIILNVCDALGYAHKQGIIHRDVKPANIMLDVQGQAILMDFGIVKILNSTSHTVSGAVVGTGRYMSPEVIRSEVPDERSDIYSLGVTFFEMLSGEPPFNAESAMSLLMRHLNDPVPDLATIREDTPSRLIEIINRMLEKDRNDRYRSVDELARELKSVLPALEPEALAKTETASPVGDQTGADTQPWIEPAPIAPGKKVVAEQPTLKDAAPKPAPKAKPVPEVHRRQPEAGTVDRPKVNPFANMSPYMKFGGAGFLGVLLLIGGWFAFRNLAPAAPEPTPPAATTQPAIPAAAATSTRTPTATITPTATSTMPPLFVRINHIFLSAGNSYVVDYETFGYTEQLPGQHIHFFFNTVRPDQAGLPGSGPWILYGGPRPFTEYRLEHRPAGATQMCALVANSNHSVIADSGNCFNLP